MVVLHKSTGATWVHAEMLPSSSISASGAHLLQMFAAQDFLKRLASDDQLLNVGIAPLDGRISQTLNYHDHEWRVETMQWHLPYGMDLRGELDALGVHLLTSFDGKQSLQSIIHQVAQNLESDLTTISHAAIQHVRRWLEVGLVTPLG